MEPLAPIADAPEQANLHMAGLLSARFRTGMRPLAVGTALVVALAAPLADFLLERHDLQERGQRDAMTLAASVGAVLSGVDSLDDVGKLRLRGALDLAASTGGQEELARIDALDTSGAVVASSSSNDAPAWPLVGTEVPLIVDGHRLGTLRVAVGEREWLLRDLLLLAAFGALGLVLALALYFFPLRLIREEDIVRLFAWRSIRAAEEERLRLSRDLHDGVGQSVGAAAVAVARLEARLGPSPEAKDCARLLDGALDELRRVARGLRPPSLDDLGLGPAVEGLARDAAEAGLQVEVKIQPLPRLDPELEQTCFRLAQEALANVVRHARAHTVAVTLAREDGQIVLEVKDDGQGFSPGTGLGLGLVGARERAARVAGRLSVESARGQGTCLRAVLPLPVNP